MTESGRALMEPQGLIAPVIPVRESCLAPDAECRLIEEIGDFATWAERDAMLVPGEYAAIGQWANAALYYVGQVNNGGHGQFAANSGLHSSTLDGIGQLLAIAGFDGLRRIFDDFLALMASPAIRERTLETAGLAGTPAEVTELDDRFFALCDRATMLGRLSDGIRGRTEIAVLPPDRVAAERAAILAANPLWQARRDERRRIVAEYEARDLRGIAVTALCQAEGEVFLRFIAGMPVRDGGTVWSFESSAGKGVLMVAGDTARLLDASFKPRGVFCAWPVVPGRPVAVLRRPAVRPGLIGRAMAWIRPKPKRG